jgi:hypothetical protein
MDAMTDPSQMQANRLFWNWKSQETRSSSFHVGSYNNLAAQVAARTNSITEAFGISRPLAGGHHFGRCVTVTPPTLLALPTEFWTLRDLISYGSQAIYRAQPHFEADDASTADDGATDPLALIQYPLDDTMVSILTAVGIPLSGLVKEAFKDVISSVPTSRWSDHICPPYMLQQLKCI